ncbi:MAG: tRNA pseudouridine(38-40) synthase TruA [Thermoplasmata archaeon]|nr:tRNA pseudouridine(38-40) synthase TruA [Thermoplasmata archaeon]
MRFGYDGAGFFGWAHQPGRRTVEGEILGALREHRQFGAHAPRTLPVASRTDRGVSARGNALALESDLTASRLLRTLNGLVPDVFFTHAVEVEGGFLPRRAAGRTYRYLEPIGDHEVGRWRALAKGFVGSFDVRSFGRGLPADRPTVRTLTRADVTQEGEWLVVELEGRSFVWGMVRKIIAALDAAESGALSEASLEAARRGDRRLALPLAEPEGLILWEVHYPFGWGAEPAALSRPQQRFWDDQRLRGARRSAVLSRVAPTTGSREEVGPRVSR